MTAASTERVRRIVAAPAGPDPVGPFSQAVVAGGFVFTSGQIPASAGDGEVSFDGQVRGALRNLRLVLEAAGTDLDHVVKVSAFLTDKDFLPEYNRIYAEVFGDALPARTTVCVDLWGVSLELDCVAVLADPTPEGTA